MRWASWWTRTRRSSGAGRRWRRRCRRSSAQVDWGELDFLVIDLPPGTGDAQLTLSQQAPLTGAVIVTTPQDVSLIDARKGVRMFQEVRVPVLGVVENMSYFVGDDGKRYDIFRPGGGKKLADEVGVPFLGEDADRPAGGRVRRRRRADRAEVPGLAGRQGVRHPGADGGQRDAQAPQAGALPEVQL